MVDVATQQLCQQHLPVPSPFTSQDAQTMLWDDALLAGSHEALLNGLPELTDAEWCEAAGVWCDGALLAPLPQCSLPPLQHQASPDTPLAWDAAEFPLPPPSHCCDVAAAPKPAPFLFGMPQQAALEQQYEQPPTPQQALQPFATLTYPLISPLQQLDCSPHDYSYDATCFAADSDYAATPSAAVADAASPTAAACTPSACYDTPLAAASPPAAAADLSSGCCDSPTASADADASSGTPFAPPLGRRHSCGGGASPVMTGGWSCPPEESPRCADIAAVLAADASVGASCTSGTPVGGKYVGVSASRTKGRFEASLKMQRRKMYLGSYTSPTVAAHAYDVAVLWLRDRSSRFRPTNFPPSHYEGVASRIAQIQDQDELIHTMRMLAKMVPESRRAVKGSLLKADSCNF